MMTEFLENMDFYRVRALRANQNTKTSAPGPSFYKFEPTEKRRTQSLESDPPTPFSIANRLCGTLFSKIQI